MAKRKKSQSRDPRIVNRTERGGYFCPEKILEQAKELEAQGRRLRNLAATMERAGLDEVKVDGQTKVVRAILLAQEFCVNLGYRIEREMLKRLDTNDTI